MDISSRYGVWLAPNRLPEDGPAAIEAAGYGTLWVGGSPDGDLQLVEQYLADTTTLQVGTGIVNIWKDDVADVAAAARRVSDRFGDRFVLGVGAGHRKATSEYRAPYEALEQYLDGLAAGGFPADRTVLAALGPKVLRLARDRTAGAHPYLTTPEHTAAARDILGAGSVLVPEQKVVLDTEPERARAVARPVVEYYLGLRNYVANLLRHGFDDADVAGSDRLIDAVVLHGDPATVARGLQAHLDAGADQVAVQPLGDDPIGDLETLAPALGR